MVGIKNICAQKGVKYSWVKINTKAEISFLYYLFFVLNNMQAARIIFSCKMQVGAAVGLAKKIQRSNGAFSGIRGVGFADR